MSNKTPTVTVSVTDERVYDYMAPYLPCACVGRRINVLLTDQGVACAACGVDLEDEWDWLVEHLGLKRGDGK